MSNYTIKLEGKEKDDYIAKHFPKTDLTQYSDDELSLQVFNDEYLYNMRHKSYLISHLDEIFIYNDDQLEVLKQDLADDEEE